jgi:hypothetical protein
MEFRYPESPMRHSRLIDAFVDDTSLGYTDASFMTLDTMINELTEMAQTWEKLLFYSGGALHLSKCSWHVMYWDWQQGRPRTRPISPDDTVLKLTTQGGTTETTIKRMPIETATCILGVHLSPMGNFSDHIIILKKKADDFAIRLRSPKLTPQEITTFHRTTYGPAMRYVLPAHAIDEEELAPIQSNVLAPMFQKLSYSSKLPTKIRHGPEELGGLALLDLRTELGISALKYMHNATYKELETGKLMQLNLKYSQIEAGILEPLLEHPCSIHLAFLTPTRITSIRQFLFNHNLKVSLTDTLQIQLRGKTIDASNPTHHNNRPT